MQKADYSLEPLKGSKGGEEAQAVLRLKGAWVVSQLRGLSQRLQASLRSYQHVRIESDQMDALDSAGALVLREALDVKLSGDAFPAGSRHANLFEMVSTATPDIADYRTEARKRRPKIYDPVIGLLAGLGRTSLAFFAELKEQFVFAGQLAVLMFLMLTRPARLRMTAS